MIQRFDRDLCATGLRSLANQQMRIRETGDLWLMRHAQHLIAFRQFLQLQPYCFAYSPADAGIVGTLALAVPAVESLVVSRDLAQVGSGDQVLRAGVTINCGSIGEPTTSRQIVLTIRDDTGRALFTETLDYEKRWCQ